MSPACETRMTAPIRLACIEFGVMEKTAYKHRYLRLGNAQVRETVAAVAQAPFKESSIQRDKRGPVQTAQKRDDFVILQSFSLKIKTDLANRDASGCKPDALMRRNVFVQNNHAGTGSST